MSRRSDSLAVVPPISMRRNSNISTQAAFSQALPTTRPTESFCAGRSIQVRRMEHAMLCTQRRHDAACGMHMAMRVQVRR